MAKTAAELKLEKEAEEIQKKEVPELYEDGEVTPVTPASEEEATPSEEVTPAPVTKEEPIVEKKETPPPVVEDIETLKAELARLKSEQSKEESARRFLSDRDKKLNQANAEIEKLKGEIETIKSSIKEKKVPEVDDVRVGLVIEHGENSKTVKMYDILNSKIESIGSKIDTSLKQVDEKVGTVDKRVFDADERVFLTDLSREVSDWEKVVIMPEFAEFLQTEKVPYTDMTLYDALLNASSKRDVKATTGIYKAFQETLKKSVAPFDTTPLKKDKEKLLSPTTTVKAELITPQTEMLSPEEVRQMKAEVVELRLKGKTKAADIIDKKIDAFLDALGTF